MLRYMDSKEIIESKYEKDIENIEQIRKQELNSLYRECIKVNGGHKDEGGMFIAVCANCGFCDDFYDPS